MSVLIGVSVKVDFSSLLCTVVVLNVCMCVPAVNKE